MDPVGTTQLAAKGVGEVKRMAHEHNPPQQHLTNTDRLIAVRQKVDQVTESVEGLIAEAKGANQPTGRGEHSLRRAGEAMAHYEHGFQQQDAHDASSNPITRSVHTMGMTVERKKAEAAAKEAESRRKAQEEQMMMLARQAAAKKKSGGGA